MCLPISNITECVNYAEEQAKKFGLRAPMVGHLGDGNFHVLLPFDPQKKETYKKIREFNDLLIKKTLELNGTITGEHGSSKVLLKLKKIFWIFLNLMPLY